jgi:hypothetical protein
LLPIFSSQSLIFSTNVDDQRYEDSFAFLFMILELNQDGSSKSSRLKESLTIFFISNFISQSLGFGLEHSLQ